MLTHTLHPYLGRPHSSIRVLIVGAGGNGSKICAGIRHLHLALQALGHPGLQVTLADGDTVSSSNLVRQTFYPSDVGLPKATVLINRINLSCGLDWRAIPHYLSAEDVRNTPAALLISCVDSRKARAVVNEGIIQNKNVVYHLDLGNTKDTGQVVLGCPLGRYNRRKRDRLRTAFELFPELTDTSIPEDDTPSCGTIEALEKQDLFVNDTLVTSALSLLWQLLWHQEIQHHGSFIDLRTGSVRPLPIDPALWRRLKRRCL